jgi:murein DD-endopeptidase MepM/ murein hydrolase activator NlpD
MPKTKRPRQKPVPHQHSGPPGYWESPQFRKKIRLINAAVVVTSVVLASILPAQPTLPTPPVSTVTQSNVPELLRSAFLLGPIGNIEEVGIGLKRAGSYATLLLSAIGPEHGMSGRMDALGLPAPTLVEASEPDALNGRGQLALALTPQYLSLYPRNTIVEVNNVETRLAYRTGTIERSLFEESQDLELSDPLIAKLVEIFSWDIDFALEAREGDSFVAIYEERYWFGRKISDGPIVAAEFLSQGRVYRAIGFRDKDGKMDYFTPEGKKLRRTFLRTPVQFSSISSRFSNSRYHPILKTWKAHNGVDYSASVGTPVRATASGRIFSIGWNGGYGNTVVIKHDKTYSTLYAHLSRYQRNLRAGDYVEQGDVIGFVGQTGLATGPHLHYEFQVNGEHRNPLTFKFPDGDSLAPTLREEFMRSARTWTTRLDVVAGRNLAAAR